MITNNQKKFVKSLGQKKFRTEHNCFVVEGVKLVNELLQSDFEVVDIYATSDWIEKNSSVDVEQVSSKDLAIMSSFKSANEVLAVVKQKQYHDIDYSEQLTIALDNVQDPGNMGTIVRTADWFGIKSIVCSKDSVDLYNPKVIQATMGSIFRVDVYYTDLIDYLSNKKNVVYAATLNGKNIYKQKLQKESAVILMGNESRGISSELLSLVNEEISIPRIGEAESLNVATATAILCAEFTK